LLVAAAGAGSNARGQCGPDGNATGLVPIDALGAGLYMGFEGGLYPGGANTPPPAHFAAALAQAGLVVPRDEDGAADFGSGRIVLITIGMSNTAHESAPFERQEDRNAERNARVLILNGALGGQAANITANPAAAYWTNVQERLAALDAAPAQVQVAWLKTAEPGPPNDFPGHAQTLAADVRRTVRNLKALFPNLRLCYLSSRTYGGYATGGLNPEPQAYESAFSMKWVVEQQIGGDPNLAYEGSAPEAPLLLWGPYLWADGITPRGDGLTWGRDDFEGDGTHPSACGEQKVADLLSAFFASEPTAQPWWSQRLNVRLVALDASADATVRADLPDAAFGQEPVLRTRPGDAAAHAYVRFDASAVEGEILAAKLSLRVTTSGSGGGEVRPVDDASWDEATLTFNTAPQFGADVLARVPNLSRDSSFAADVTDALRSDADGEVSFALVGGPGGGATYHSREAGDGPRLILSVRLPRVPGDVDGDRDVDLVDLSLLLAAFGTCEGDAAYNPAADLNRSLCIDLVDLGIVLANYGTAAG